MKLLIDSGNTRLKWATLESDKLSEVNSVVQQSDSFLESLRQHWTVLATPKSIVISCVSGSRAQLESFLIELWPNSDLNFVQSANMAHGIKNTYSNPIKLGVDRWLAMIAAKNEYTGSLCIVDCGTAITLDCLDERGQHLGGMILPGWNLMQQSLHKGTANLEISNKTYPLGLANNTQAAIFNGRLAAVKGFIEMGMAQSNQLILTGGDAEFLNKELQLSAVLDLNLVLKGLALEAI